MKTAIFVDGAFFIRRIQYLYKKKRDFDTTNAESIVSELENICYRHLNQKNKETGEYDRAHDLYRIFFYDCLPLSKRVSKPISKDSFDFSTTEQYKLRLAILECLKRKPKTALRLGKLQDMGGWKIKPDVLKNLLEKTVAFEDLTDDDFSYEVRQKSVDMKIGIDIASVSYKKQAERIVLISGDSDFVPAAKLARREGIEFILDPMWQPISSDLFEHIDGLSSTCFRLPPAGGATA